MTAHLGGVGDGGYFGLGIGGAHTPSSSLPAGTGASGPEGDPLLRQWGANLAVMAGHRGMPGAGEAMVALGDRLRVEADQVCESGGVEADQMCQSGGEGGMLLNLPHIGEDKLHLF